MHFRFWRIALSLTILASSADVLWGQSLSLQATAPTVTPGASAAVDIRFDAQGGAPPSAMQWTMQFAPADLQLVQVTVGAASSAAGKSLSCSPGASSVTCVLVGMNTAVISTGVVATATFQATAAFPASSTVSVFNQAAASGAADPLTVAAQGVQLNRSVVVGPPPPPTSCTYVATAGVSSFPAGGGSGVVSMTSGEGCAWQVASTVPWITFPTSVSGTANGTVAFSVASNGGAPRTGTIIAGGKTVTITQSAAGSCSYSVTSGSLSVPGSGGTGVITVTAGSGCDWEAESTVPWITLTASESGTGNGTVSFSVAANGASPRTGAIEVAGQMVNILQSASCAYTVSASNLSFPASGGSGVISVSSASGCTWQAASSSSWVTLPGSVSGTGNGTVSFTLGPNDGVPRAGAVVVAGNTLSISQAAISGVPVQITGSMPHVAAGGSWRTTITLVNTGDSSAQATLDFFDNAGRSAPFWWSFPQSPQGAPQLASSLTRILPPGATFLAETVSAPTVTEGWTQLQTSGSIKGFAVFTNTLTGQEAVVPLESDPGGPRMLAFDNTNGIATGVAIANLSAGPINVPVTLRSTNGAILGTSTIALAARGHQSFMLDSTYPATASRRGTVEFTAPGAASIGVVGIRANGGPITTLPTLGAPAADGFGTIAHVAAGMGWKTTLTFVNTRGTPADVDTAWFDDNGTPLSMPVRNLVTGATILDSETGDEVPGSGSLVLEAPASDTPSLVSGSVQFHAIGVNGFAIFRFAGTGQEAAVPAETRNASSYLLAFDNTYSLSTGLALANLAGAPTDVAVLFRDDNGASLGAASIHLAANGHSSFMLGPPYPVTANRRGTVEFITPPGGRIAVLGLRGAISGKLTTLPVLTRTP